MTPGPNVFSERRVSQWGWTWGQFLDHTFGLRQGDGPTATAFNIPFNANDPLEEFSNNLGVIAMNRSAQSAGTGTSTANPRQQTNTLPSYIGGNPVYGATNARLDWLRNGSQDGNPTNNQATLMLPGGYLPRKTARGNAATAPAMDTDGRLLANPNNAAVAGDPRANENIAPHRDAHAVRPRAQPHRRPAAQLTVPGGQVPDRPPGRDRGGAVHHLPGVAAGDGRGPAALHRLQDQRQHDAVATSSPRSGYRAHSQIHGEFEVEVAAGHLHPGAARRVPGPGHRGDRRR